MTGNGTLTSDALPASGRIVDAEVGAWDLISAMAADPWGRTSPSVYETGRLVSLAPWLPGHGTRIDHLLREQRPDGGWGAPEGYALVPTLSAAEALLATYLRITDPRDRLGGPRSPWSGLADLPASLTGPRLAAAIGRALRALAHWLRPGCGLRLADTPAADLIVPALVARINAYLDGFDEGCARPAPWSRWWRLPLPPGITDARLVATRRVVTSGAQIPEKLLHALEVVDGLARRTPRVRPTPLGVVGASPAATAAWLGGPGDGYADAEATAARRFLAQVIGLCGGPVPCAAPIAVFERSWVLSGLLRVGMAPAVPDGLVPGLAAAVGPAGAAAGPGLPADADTTSVVLYTLARLGMPTTPDSLWRYDTGAHFCTWIGEDGCSVTTNAHVLEAVGHDVAGGIDRTGGTGRTGGIGQWGGPSDRAHRLAVARRLSAWLAERQEPSGEWHDRWHASPYYATACAALALDRYGSGAAAGRAVSRAVDWVLETQRADGSWGRWTGTVEETAYAMQVLLATTGPADGTGSAGRAGSARPGGAHRDRITAAAVRGYSYLLDATGQAEDPPLWHDKDLYTPYAIVRSATLAALWLAQSRPELVTTTNPSIRERKRAPFPIE